MQKLYYEALKLFNIQPGFVEDQLEEIYASLKEVYRPEEFPFASSEYYAMSNKRHEINRAYFWLREPFSHYIMNQNSGTIDEEKMIDEISRLIYDYEKKEISVDKKFITKLVEILVSFKSLHQYVTDVRFCVEGKNSLAEYSKTGTLNISDPDSSGIERSLASYYQTVITIRHEIEHALWLKYEKCETSDIRSILSKACTTYLKKYEDAFGKIISYPTPIFELLHIVLKLRYHMQYQKYLKNWSYSPKERVADLSGYFLVLSLLEQVTDKGRIQELQCGLIEEAVNTLLFGYDKLLGPTDFYLSRFHQIDDCCKLLEIGKSLSLEERLLFGFSLTGEELIEVKSNKEKVLSGIRKIC